jgi:hypothetical protein
MKAPKIKEKSRKTGRISRLMRSLLALGMTIAIAVLLAMSPDLAIPVVFLLLPSLVTLLIDTTPGLGLARAMLLFQSTVGIGAVQHAYYDCAGLSACMTRICTPATVIATWLAAGCAWALTEVAPIVLRLLEDVRLRARRVDLQKQRADLVEEWGLEPAGTGGQRNRRR